MTVVSNMIFDMLVSCREHAALIVPAIAPPRTFVADKKVSDALSQVSDELEESRRAAQELKSVVTRYRQALTDNVLVEAAASDGAERRLANIENMLRVVQQEKVEPRAKSAAAQNEMLVKTPTHRGGGAVPLGAVAAVGAGGGGQRRSSLLRP